jgi:hypothetical protein
MGCRIAAVQYIQKKGVVHIVKERIGRRKKGLQNNLRETGQTEERTSIAKKKLDRVTNDLRKAVQNIVRGRKK